MFIYTHKFDVSYVYIYTSLSLDLLVSRKKSPINDSSFDFLHPKLKKPPNLLRFQAEEHAAASGPFRHLDLSTVGRS